MKKRYKLESGMDTGITLEIDTTKMTAEIAGLVNEFWSGAESVLDASEGDVFQAVARRAAGPLLGYLLDGYHARGAVEVLAEQEGWPSREHLGITIIDHDFPDLEADMYEVTEVAT